MMLDDGHHLFPLSSIGNVTLRGSVTSANELPLTVGEGASMILAGVLSIFFLCPRPPLSSLLLCFFGRSLGFFPIFPVGLLWLLLPQTQACLSIRNGISDSQAQIIAELLAVPVQSRQSSRSITISIRITWPEV